MGWVVATGLAKLHSLQKVSNAMLDTCEVQARYMLAICYCATTFISFNIIWHSVIVS